MCNRVSCVIYDLDGLLLDTEPFYTQVSQQIAQRYAKVYDWSLKPRLMGKKALDSAKIFTESLGLPITPEAYLEEREALLVSLFPKADPLPGAVRLTRHLFHHNVHQAVATSSDRRHFELKISRHRDWFGIFQCIVLGDGPDIKQGKPAPDIFLAAARRLDADPARCLVFEDSLAGVEAARSAGMFVIAVPDPQMPHSAFPKAHKILRDLTQFNPDDWGLPGYTAD